MRNNTAVMAIALGLCSVGTRAQQAAPADLRNPLVATNVGGVADWMRTHEFNDMMKQARTFGPHPGPWAGTVRRNADGWPLADGGTVFLTAQPPNIGLGGTYRFSFECDELPFIRKYDSSGTLGAYWHDATTGVVHGEWHFPENGEKLILSFAKTNGSLRNLRWMRPDAREGEVFTRHFTDLMQGFGAIRFMAWTRTNDSTISQWSQRTRLEDATYRDKSGVPFEVCVDLCNQLQRDMWINVPHMANDDFIRELARLIAARLDPQLAVYVEYSNEVWNYQFVQADWNLDRAIEEAALPGSVLVFDGPQDIDTLRHRRYAKRTVELGRIFSEEFGAGSLNTRVRPVLGAQFVARWQHDKMLAFIEGVYGPAREHIYALTVAPYFTARPEDNQPGLTPEQVLNALQRNLDTLRDSYEYEKLAATTAWHGLAPFIAYEGAPDTAGTHNQYAKWRASYDPRMGEICKQYLDDWFKAGGGLFLWFHAGAGDWINTNGSWSIIETRQQASPKLDAVKLVAGRDKPGVTAGVPFPPAAGTEIDARRHLERHSNWQSLPHELMGPNDERDYLVRVEEAGRYPIALRGRAFVPSTQLIVEVNGQNVGSIVLGGGITQPEWFGPVTATMQAGLNVIRVRCTDNGYQFSLSGIGTGPFAACDSIDFNNDASIFDPLDIASFLSVYGEGPCLPEGAACNDVDFNNDSSVFDPQDIAAFLSVYGEGPCL